MFQTKANMTPFSYAVDPVPAAPLPPGDQFDSHGSRHKIPFCLIINDGSQSLSPNNLWVTLFMQRLVKSLQCLLSLYP